ncbi:MAG: hypothetical protein Q7J15_04785 [Candidatus Desulfaltia sp.]|nr:hypothetical protein [Candidatus Desulfaltia sp.]
MKLQRLSLWIKIIGRLAAFLGVVAFVTAIDAFIDGAERSVNTYPGYPAMNQPISGKSSKPIESTEKLSYTISANDIVLHFTGAESSVWHHAWSGALKIGSSIEPGEYALFVSCGAEIPEKRITQYKIVVYKDFLTYKDHIKSYVRRYLGVCPWWIFLGILPFFGLCFGIVYYLSGQKEAIMATSGRSEISKLKLSEENWLISFGLGSKHGIKENDIVSVYTPDGTKIGTVKVKEVFSDISTATAPKWQKIKPDYEIRLRL